MSLKNTLLGLSLLLPALLAQAQDYTVGDLHIQEVWSRAMPPVAPTAAAYFVVHNAGSQSDRLLAASTAHAARAELHEHRHADGVGKPHLSPNRADCPVHHLCFGSYYLLVP